MSGFREVRLGDVLMFQRGFDITKNDQSVGNVPIVSSSGVSSFHDKWQVKGPGVVIGRKGTLGTVHFISSNYWPHDTTLWVKDFKGNDPRFLHYFIQTLKLENFDVGASNPTLNRNHIHRIKILFPKDIDTQRKISAILAGYDDLIEINKKRIMVLEKLAEEIYREWFVRLRFPGYASTTVVKGLPQGWTLEKLEHAFKFTGGGTPSREVGRFWTDGDINWFTPSDITGGEGIFLERSGEKITEEGFKNSSAKMFPPYSLMLTSRATIGAIGINLTLACTNQGFISCIPNAQYPLPYLYHWLKLAKQHFESLAGGATFAELTKGTFKRIEILTPPEPIVQEFARIEMPLMEAIEFYVRANGKLIETKGKLLSRLVSGKLSVQNLDIQLRSDMAEELKVEPGVAVRA